MVIALFYNPNSRAFTIAANLPKKKEKKKGHKSFGVLGQGAVYHWGFQTVDT